MRVAAAVMPLRAHLSRAQQQPAGAGPPLVASPRSRAPLRFVLARIAARLVASRAWERLGFARLADYARERTGLSARQLQDLARTSERLAALPALEAALAAGRLGWSQARLVARVATPEDEARWIAFARQVPVRALEHAVRAVDLGSLEGSALETDEDGGDPTYKVGIVVRCTPRVRAKFHGARALARRVAGEALPVWACMEAVAAEALSALPVGVESPDDGDALAAAGQCGEAGEGGACWAERSTARPRALPLPREEPLAADSVSEAANVCETHRLDPLSLVGDSPVSLLADGPTASLLAGLEHADAFEIDARLRRAISLEQRLDAELAGLLADLARTRGYRLRGFPTLEGFARDRLGISPRKARALLRIERAAARCPELRRAFASGRLSWVQVQALLAVLAMCDAEGERIRWIEFAEEVSVRRLEDEVDRALTCGGGGPEQERQTCAQPTPAETEPETARFLFNAPPDVARLFHATVCSVRRMLERANGRLPSEGSAIEWMFDHAWEAWGANQPCVRREHQVFERDGWRCTVPGCSSYRNLHDHHIVFRAAGGSDAPGNRTTLCAWHHLRGVHAARVRCTGIAPGALVFELGLRPGREPLLRYAPGERRRPEWE
jgi:hypothetical protein